MGVGRGSCSSGGRPSSPPSQRRCRPSARARHARRVGREEWLDAGELAVSEVVTNAALHAHTPIDLHLEVLADRLRVAVRDRNPEMPLQRHYDDEATTGRGMGLSQPSPSSAASTASVPRGRWRGSASETRPTLRRRASRRRGRSTTGSLQGRAVRRRRSRSRRCRRRCGSPPASTTKPSCAQLVLHWRSTTRRRLAAPTPRGPAACPRRRRASRDAQRRARAPP
jgi:hypothetical protein